MIEIIRYLPRKWISQVVGYIAHWQGPFFLVLPLIYYFAKYYRINLDECQNHWSSYPSLGEFFIRQLKSEARPIANSWAVHPADSVITQCGELKASGELIQAKGLHYHISDLLVDAEWQKKFENGSYAVYYLCPTDYHRVHSPVDGFITKVTYVPGDLWPVNQWSTSHIQNLFAVNERVIVEITTEIGMVSVVFVGATNVGQICLSFDESIRGNQNKPYDQKIYSTPIKIKKGEELGLFRMGSTVILVCPPFFHKKMNSSFKLGQVQVGQPFI